MAFLRRTAEFLLNRFMLSFLGIAIVLALLWAFRYTLLRATGDMLIDQDKELHADAIYVLGGSPIERGREAARLLGANKADLAFCTGENYYPLLAAEGIDLTEAELSQNAMLRTGADSSKVSLLQTGTSTWEEAGVILAHATANSYDTITVVSTEFHLRRVKRVLRKQGKGKGITVLVRGAYSDRYDSNRWWQSEEGLLMVNNEYVKLMYYLWKY